MPTRKPGRLTLHGVAAEQTTIPAPGEQSNTLKIPQEQWIHKTNKLRFLDKAMGKDLIANDMNLHAPEGQI